MGLLQWAFAGAVGYGLYKYANSRDGKLQHAAFAPGETDGANFANQSEFVELDAEGNPVVSDTEDEGRKPARRAPAKKAASKRGRAASVPPPGNDDKAGLERAEAEVAENEAADEDAAK